MKTNLKSLLILLLNFIGGIAILFGQPSFVILKDGDGGTGGTIQYAQRIPIDPNLSCQDGDYPPGGTVPYQITFTDQINYITSQTYDLITFTCTITDGSGNPVNVVSPTTGTNQFSLSFTYSGSSSFPLNFITEVPSNFPTNNTLLLNINVAQRVTGVAGRGGKQTGGTYWDYDNFASIPITICDNFASSRNGSIPLNLLEKASDISVFPNPFNEYIEVRFNAGETVQPAILMSDIQGRQWKVPTTQKYIGDKKWIASLETSSLAKGIYTCQVKVGNTQYVHKIVKY